MTLLPLALLVAALAAVRGMWSPCGLSMLSQLNPVAETARRHRWWLTALWYVAGAVAGGALLGAACAGGAALVGLTHLPSGAVTALVLVGAAVGVLSDSRLVAWALPVHPRQVDERWLVRYRRWLYAAGYGVQIGTGFATYIMTAAVYVTALLAVLTGSPVQAFGIGVTFGLVRGLCVLVTARARTPQALRTLVGRVDRLGDPALQLVAAVVAAMGAGAAGRLGGPVAALAAAAVLGPLAVGRRGRTARATGVVAP